MPLPTVETVCALQSSDPGDRIERAVCLFEVWRTRRLLNEVSQVLDISDRYRMKSLISYAPPPPSSPRVPSARTGNQSAVERVTGMA